MPRKLESRWLLEKPLMVPPRKRFCEGLFDATSYGSVPEFLKWTAPARYSRTKGSFSELAASDRSGSRSGEIRQENVWNQF
jgi:hypothetical protein